MPEQDFVSVTLVTYNSGRFIKRCLETVLSCTYLAKEIIVIDNASTDGTIGILEQFTDRCKIVFNDENIGFAAAQNQAIRMSRGEYILALNPDVLLMPGFIMNLVQTAKQDPRAGTVCGKLLALSAHFEIPDTPLIDSTGIYFTPTLRHLDRGSQEVDEGHYTEPEYVFGATAAAALYRRRMIDDISIDGEFFDEDFFVYREDADVAWRAQLMGWRCLYTPYALGYHVRTVTPGNRRALPAVINMHSVKNRFLMRIKNMTPGLYKRNFWSVLGRDIVVVGACLLHEHTSLKAFWFLAKNWNRFIAKRREIMRRSKVSDEYMARWFDFTPVAFAATNIADPGLLETGTAIEARPSNKVEAVRRARSM